ncbi:hypothetical protein [Bifidobacterium asteroides]|uniref:hypothetical protein n=1 Tax=Bifidobacterium asteroides TaxID=1684 RepID=UPI00274145A4|nr:hypothetical protein [Bifidobacterium asteroides]WLT10078.1 hypothetical protein RAM15_04990 [Bifidobacterium asteroides]
MADKGPRLLDGLTSTMTYGQMRRYADTLNVTISSALLPAGMTGFYDEATRTILIDRQLIYCQKHCTLVHELIHWQHADTTRDGVFGSRLENRTRRETALKLVNPLEYQTAEAMYEGDPYQIACELDVTLQIIQDYRILLNEQLTHAPRRPIGRQRWKR